MSQPNDRIWILLVQKSPKGPFTLAEVNALLDKGIIRRNDLALKMEAKEAGLDGKKVGGSWKILWQYPEFDRRKDEVGEGGRALAAPVPMPPREGERRSLVDDKKKAGLVKELLPEELGEIKAEDLIGKSSREIRREDEGGSTASELSFNSDLVRPSDDERGAPKWIYALLVLAVGGGLYGWISAVNPLGKKSVSRTAASADALPTGGAADDVPALRHNTPPSSLGRGNAPTAQGRRSLPMVQPLRRAPEPPPPVARREPEPNRREESRLDSPADDRQTEGDRGEISADDNNEERSTANSEDEVDPPNKPPRPKGRRAKEAISDEDGGDGPGNDPNGEAVSPSEADSGGDGD